MKKTYISFDHGRVIDDHYEVDALMSKILNTKGCKLIIKRVAGSKEFEIYSGEDPVG